MEHDGEPRKDPRVDSQVIFLRGAKTVQKGRSSTNGARKTEHPHAKE